jgi:hypothetical protein
MALMMLMSMALLTAGRCIEMMATPSTTLKIKELFAAFEALTAFTAHSNLATDRPIMRRVLVRRKDWE